MRVSVLLAAALWIPAAALADTTWVAVDSPAVQNSIPFDGGGSYRCQWLYYHNEINLSGDIVALGLYSAADAPAAYYHVTVSCCHTPLTDLTTNFSDNYGGRSPEIFLQAETLVVGTGVDSAWYYFPGSFVYNDSDNLLIEITWHGCAGSVERFYRNGNSSAYRRCWSASDTSSVGSRDDVMGDYMRFGFLLTGVAERKQGEVRGEKAGPTVVSEVLRLPPASHQTLLDISGRTILALRPGANDVSRLRPGVYFLAGAGEGHVTKVILAR